MSLIWLVAQNRIFVGFFEVIHNSNNSWSCSNTPRIFCFLIITALFQCCYLLFLTMLIFHFLLCLSLLATGIILFHSCFITLVDGFVGGFGCLICRPDIVHLHISLHCRIYGQSCPTYIHCLCYCKFHCWNFHNNFDWLELELMVSFAPYFGTH